MVLDAQQDMAAGDLQPAPAPAAPPGTLQFGPQTAGKLAGAYAFTNGGSATFAAVLDPKVGVASATWADAKTGTTVTVNMTGPKAAEVQIGGQTLTGHGTLTPPQAAALEAFAASDLALASALAVLELGCKVDKPEDAVHLATLVVPW